jgi:hypothetical protein
MRIDRYEEQIYQPVILSVAIPMMHHIVSGQPSPKSLFNDISMLEHPAMICARITDDLDAHVAMRCGATQAGDGQVTGHGPCLHPRPCASASSPNAWRPDWLDVGWRLYAFDLHVSGTQA